MPAKRKLKIHWFDVFALFVLWLAGSCVRYSVKGDFAALAMLSSCMILWFGVWPSLPKELQSRFRYAWFVHWLLFVLVYMGRYPEKGKEHVLIMLLFSVGLLAGPQLQKIKSTPLSLVLLGMALVGVAISSGMVASWLHGNVFIPWVGNIVPPLLLFACCAAWGFIHRAEIEYFWEQLRKRKWGYVFSKHARL